MQPERAAEPELEQAEAQEPVEQEPVEPEQRRLLRTRGQMHR